MQRTLGMGELTRHSTIMDRYDPDRRVALIVNEWGTWHDPEPGTNPVDDPHAVRVAPFDNTRYADGVFRARLPAMSVVAVQIG